MLRINLLPVKVKQRQHAVARQLILGGSVLGVIFLGLSAHYIFAIESPDEIRTLVDKYQSEIATYDRLIGKGGKQKKVKGDLKRKVQVINQLKRNKSGPVRLLEQLSLLVPKKLWISSMDQKTLDPFNHEITLTGLALSNEVIADFWGKLQDSPYFKEVNLVKSSMSASKGITTQSFNINAKFILPAPPGSEEDEEKEKKSDKK